MPSHFSIRNSGKKPEIKEEDIYVAVAYHLKTCWPDVLYRFDYGAGISLGWKAAKRQKLLQKGRAFPDLLIYEPVPRRDISASEFLGLALEIKRGGERLVKKDGSFVTQHVEEQNAILWKFKEIGWEANFTIGLKGTIDAIDNYLSRTNAKRRATLRY